MSDRSSQSKTSPTWPPILGLIIVAVIVGSCLASGNSKPSSAPTTTSGNSASQTWLASNNSTISRLANDEGSVQQDALTAAKSGDMTTLAADCQALGSDVRGAQSLTPIPDAIAEGQWASVLSDLSGASNDCTNGIAQQDVGLLTQAANELQSADTATNALTKSLLG